MYRGDPRGWTPIHRPTEVELEAVVDELIRHEPEGGGEEWVAIVDGQRFYLSPESTPVKETEE